MLPSSGECFFKSSPHFYLHLFGLNLVMWPHLSAKGVGKCGLSWTYLLPPKIMGPLLLWKGKWIMDREQGVSARTDDLEERYGNTVFIIQF